MTAESTLLPQLARNTLVFQGDPDSPLLAPRGVFLANHHLFVADTAQNRLFIWKHLPETSHQKPDIVLGQSDRSDTGRNANTGVNASSLFYPSGIWSDGQRLIVADAWNHRVLIWHEFPTTNGQAADVVLGQPDFFSNQPNVHGIGRAPNEKSLNWPYGVFSDGKRLWIADTGNRRVLFFNQIPLSNFAPADQVIGKPDFFERDYDHRDPIWPYSVKISPTGAMAITDTQYYRVLLWHDWQRACHEKADFIIGQTDFDSNGQNQFSFFPRANTLNWCYDTCFYRDGIWISDSGNSRILWFDTLPKQNNAAAHGLLGQDNFVTGSENKNTIWTTEDSLYWPFQICTDQNILVAADTGNHRIVINHLNF